MADPSPSGKTTSDEYDIKRDVVGMLKNPVHPASIRGAQSSGFNKMTNCNRVYMIKENNKPKYKNKLHILMMYLYWRVVLTLRIKKNDDKRPENIAANTIKAAVLPD